MKKDLILETVAAIEKHMTTATPKGVIVMKYIGYDHVPQMAVCSHYLERAKEFLAAYAQAGEFQNEIGQYNPADLMTMRYLFKLSDWGREDLARDQQITQFFKQGKEARLDIILPKIQENKKHAEAAINFLGPVSRLYSCTKRILDHDTNYAEKSAEQLNTIEWLAITRTLTFVGLHNNPQIIAAQTEIAESLAPLAEKYHEVMGKARESECGITWMSLGQGSTDAYRTDSGIMLPQSFQDFMQVSGLGNDLDKILMEDAPAGKYFQGMVGEVLEAAFSKTKTPEESAIETKKLWDEYTQEKQSVKLAEYQPRGHVDGQEFNFSLRKAKESALEIIKQMNSDLERFSQDLATQTCKKPSFLERLSGKLQGSGPSRGGESTKPAPREGDWAANT